MERIEVYPYQRIKESPFKRMLDKHLLKLNQKLPVDKLIPFSFNTENARSELLTAHTLIFCLLAFIMAQATVLGELLSFMFAAVAALSRRRPYTGIAMVICSLVGIISMGEGLSLFDNGITLLALVAIVNIIKMSEDKYWWGIPLLTAATIFLVKNIFYVSSSITLYQEMVIVFEALTAGILTLAFMVGHEILQQKKKLYDFAFEDVAAFLIIGVGLIMGLSEVTIAGLSISGILCRLGILIAALLWGAGRATMAGVMVGIIPSITSGLFAYSLALYTISGLLAGLFRIMGKLGIMIGFMLGSMAVCLFIPETQTNVLGIWETAIACLVFIFLPGSLDTGGRELPVLNLPLLHKKHHIGAEESISTVAVDRVKQFARIFDEMAASLEDQAKAPGRRISRSEHDAYMNYFFEGLTDSICKRCLYKERCWEKNCYWTAREIINMVANGEPSGEINPEHCSQEFKRTCVYNREVVNTLNHLLKNVQNNLEWKKTLDQSCSIISNHMRTMSNVIHTLASDFNREIEIDYELKDKLMRETRKMGFKMVDMTPVKSPGGDFNIKVIMNSCAGIDSCESEVIPAVSAIIGDKVEVCRKECPRLMGKGYCNFELKRTFSYRLSSGVAQIGKENVCGDSFTIATLAAGIELIALSDGMGVGENACAQSQSAVRMLEMLLDAGFDREMALKTINSMLILRSSREDFATLDIVMMDLYSAGIDFIKTGSAPSFIKRGKRVEMISGSSHPVGILDKIDFSCETRQLLPGDMIVMTSDGVMDYMRDCAEEKSNCWIIDLLASVPSGTDPQEVAELILNRALSLCQGTPNDDMTVICMNVELNLPS